MANTYFQFKQFIVHQDKCGMKVTTDACLFGAWVTRYLITQKITPASCLDIGTGTGLLSLMLAQQYPVIIDAVEIDPDAAAQAIENVSRSPWNNRITVHQTDITKFSITGNYDLIISNPPFYEKELKGTNPVKNIAHHQEGLLLRDLFYIIKKSLSDEGRFFLLLPYKRKEEIRSLLNETGLGTEHITQVRQSVNHPYFRILLAGRRYPSQAEPTTGELSIKDHLQQYTPDFISLLKDYYLAF